MKEDELFLQRFGQNLKKLRKSKKLTLQELEVMANIDNSNLSKYESGNIDIRLTTVYKLSKALEIKLSDLFKQIE